MVESAWRIHLLRPPGFVVDGLRINHKKAVMVDVLNGHMANSIKIVVSSSSLSTMVTNRRRYETQVRLGYVKWAGLLSLSRPAC